MSIKHIKNKYALVSYSVYKISLTQKVHKNFFFFLVIPLIKNNVFFTKKIKVTNFSFLVWNFCAYAY